MTIITPYRISVTDAVLADLKARLRNTRWPEAELVNDLSQGAPLKWIEEICQYWAEEYDWRRRDARLNRFSQFTTELDGLNTHFIHVRSPHPGAMPLVITHGWPGSVVEFHKVIEPLTDPTAHGGDAADAFHVVCPSIPGFGFSRKADDHGLGCRSDRVGVGDFDGSPWVHAIRCARWRLGRDDYRLARFARSAALRWYPRHAGDEFAAQRHRRAHARGGAGPRWHRVLPRVGLRSVQRPEVW